MRRPCQIVPVIAAILVLQACSDGNAASDAPPTPAIKVVALGDGTTMVAPPNSLARSLVEWTRSADRSEAQFQFGEDGFLPGSPSLSKIGIKRATNLGLVLRGTPGAILVLPATDKDGDEPTDLTSRRSLVLANFLKERGLLADQVRQGSASGEALATADAASGLDFMLERRLVDASAQDGG